MFTFQPKTDYCSEITHFQDSLIIVATLIMKLKNNKINLVDLLYIIRYLKYNFNMSKLEMQCIHYVYG